MAPPDFPSDIGDFVIGESPIEAPRDTLKPQLSGSSRQSVTLAGDSGVLVAVAQVGAGIGQFVIGISAIEQPRVGTKISGTAVLFGSSNQSAKAGGGE